MLRQHWQRLIMVLLISCVVSHRCFAGPIKRPMFCTQEEQSVPSNLTFLTNPFPRPVPFPQSPTIMFQSNRFNLTHITAPPEFRARDSNTKNAIGIILPLGLWPPCEVWHGRVPLPATIGLVDHKLLHGGSPGVNVDGRDQAITRFEPQSRF